MPRTSTASQEERPVAKTVATALRILSLFTHASPTWTVKELAHQLDVPYSTTYRYVSTIEALGFLVRDGTRGVYTMGLPAIELGGVALNQLEVRRYGLSYLDHLADVTNCNGNLAILYQADILHIGFAIRTDVSQTYAVLGRRATAHCTAMGKALLADLPFEEVRQLIEAYGWRPYTPNSIRNFADLERELLQTRERGYATDYRERTMTSHCLAAPIRNRTGAAVAAISITFPPQRSTELDNPETARHVVEHANMISHHLGFTATFSHRTLFELEE